MRESKRENRKRRPACIYMESYGSTTQNKYLAKRKPNRAKELEKDYKEEVGEVWNDG